METNTIQISFEPMKEEHLEYFIGIRNQVCEFLENDSQFTLEECRSWFRSAMPVFYLVYIDSERVGYIRTSNDDLDHGAIWIGMDIDPVFQGRKLATPIYQRFMFFLQALGYRNLFLNVLESNEKALNLYRKLGFVLTGEKKVVQRKTGQQIASLNMHKALEPRRNDLIQSSYLQNNIGKTLFDFVVLNKPEKIVEFGVLNGYSTVHFGLGLEFLNQSGRVFAYDIWEKYQFRNSKMDQVQQTLDHFHLANRVILGEKDLFQWIEEEESFDLLHIDISNDGDILSRIIKRLKSQKTNAFKGTQILFEGGIPERDEVEWMKKYKKDKIIETLTKNGIGFVNLSSRFPGVSMVKL